MDWREICTIAGSSCAAAGVVLGSFRLPRRRGGGGGGAFAEAAEPCVFLFDRTDLVDASGGARELLAASPLDGDAWTRFLSYVTPRFPGVEEKLAGLPGTGRVTLPSATRNPLTLRAEFLGGLTRILLVRGPGADGEQASDGLGQRALEDEVEAMRATMDRAPFLVWREDAERSVTWANRAYLELVQTGRAAIGPLPWPLPALFPALRWDGSTCPAQQRISHTAAPGGEPRWFDSQCFAQGTDRVVFALPANAAIQAERALQSFVQTLTKTFAHLTLGLAIFDRNRQLALFNPALIDLTGLSPEFLSSRPTLLRLLDTMRERQMLPEPQDYKTWRAEIAALEQAAASGQYEETWTLPNGQTYRVTGRPHPDGALAFVFEDISAEMMATRRFNAELELTRAVIDASTEAVAVFAPSGLLVLSNAAYDRLWNEAAPRPAQTTISDAMRLWQQRSAVSPVWHEARAFVLETGERRPWSGETRLADGRLLACRFLPLPGGASLIGFQPVAGGRRPGRVEGGARASA